MDNAILTRSVSSRIWTVSIFIGNCTLQWWCQVRGQGHDPPRGNFPFSSENRNGYDKIRLPWRRPAAPTICSTLIEIRGKFFTNPRFSKPKISKISSNGNQYFSARFVHRKDYFRHPFSNPLPLSGFRVAAPSIGELGAPCRVNLDANPGPVTLKFDKPSSTAYCYNSCNYRPIVLQRNQINSFHPPEDLR